MKNRTQIYNGEHVHAHTETFGDWKPGIFYSVYFGDTGYECDPGVEAEPRDTAITEVKTAIRELQELLRVLEDQALQGLPADQQEAGAVRGSPLRKPLAGRDEAPQGGSARDAGAEDIRARTR